MAIQTSSLGIVTGWHINIAPQPDDIELGDPEETSGDLEEASLLPHELAEAECVPFLSSRVLFLPVPSGEALRRMRFLALPLQMLFR